MAATRRRERVAALLKKEISIIIDQKLKDPAKGFPTVNKVRVSPDLRVADIYYSVLGDDEQREKTQQVLKHSTGFIKNELKPFLKTRVMPDLRFHYDDSLEYADKINRLFDKIHDSADPDSEK